MIVVLGHLDVDAAHRAEHLERSVAEVRAARQAPGCLHFTVTADPIEPTHVAVAELWASREELEAYRNSGSGDDSGDDDADPFRFVREFHVQEYELTD